MVSYREKECIIKEYDNIPGNLFGFLIGTNFAPIANAIGGPNIKPLASIPAPYQHLNNMFMIK